VQLQPFALERYFAAYEFNVDYLLSASDPESLPLSELLELADPECRNLWRDLTLGYTDSQGHPLLRAEVARLYASISPRDVLVAVPEEAIFVAMNVLLRPGDHVIATFPGYQSLYQVAEAVGCAVTRWPLVERDGRWELDLGFLEGSLRPETRLIVVNFPHNPTGFLPARSQLEGILDLARRRNIYVFSDEMYRLLEYDPSRRLPAVCDLYDRGISLSGLSKAFALPGLRIGWLATADPNLLAAFSSFKDYTTICNSAPAEILAIVALRARDPILARNLAIIGANLLLAEAFFAHHPARFAWLKPLAGSVALPRWLGEPSVDALCAGLRQRKNTMLLPGSVFEYGAGYFRLGLGRRNFAAALTCLEEYLHEEQAGNP
jgi:aspartate/methionine/tyrosine aminotransferase